MDRVNQSGDSFSSGGNKARLELQYELIHHQNILDRAVADDPRMAGFAAAEEDIADRGYAALARAWSLPGNHGSGLLSTLTVPDPR